VVCINFQSIKNKKEELWNLVDSSDPDIIFGTETWLNNNITNSEISPSDMNYDVVRNDRENSYSGVLIAFKKNFIFEAITLKNLSLETLCCYIS
jgi:exonuclease III